VTLRERWSRITRAQESLAFRAIASIAILAIAAAIIVVQVVRDNAPPPLQPDGTPAASAPAAPAQPLAPTEGETDADRLERERLNAGIAASDRILRAITERAGNASRIYEIVLITSAVALIAVWLGLGVSLGTVLLVAAIAFTTAKLAFPTAERAATLIAGLAILFTLLVTLLRVAALALSAPLRPLAIARNVLTEAIRLRVTGIFIIMLFFALAALPGLLDAETPLRYRVQSFLQWGTSGSFFIIAILTVVFAAATVAFEQRDKIIWQTMTKPVSHFEYVLGKWLGVTALAGVLLAVSSLGVYAFTQYLRAQPALGESAAYVAQGDQGAVSDDRRILETQVLAARTTVQPNPPEIDEEAFASNLAMRVEEEARRLTAVGAVNSEAFQREQVALRENIEKELRKSVLTQFRSLESAETRYFEFDGLSAARDSDTPIILRYKINSGSDRPDAIYRLTFLFPGVQGALVQEVGLGKFHYLELLPTVIDDNGRVVLGVTNGDVSTNRANELGLSFPADGLELSFSSGGFEANFLRVVAVLWLKLAFLAMVGVFAATFTSFPVACLVSLVVFFAAEGAGFLLDALDNYRTETDEGKTIYFNVVIAFIATWIGRAFKVYSELRPTSRLVDGQALGWHDVARGTLVVSISIALLYASAVFAFRRRELATYSGNG
jgi:ABC-type transport system involved in multi-copper enzyme maturation permease subunit